MKRFLILPLVLLASMQINSAGNCKCSIKSKEEKEKRLDHGFERKSSRGKARLEFETESEQKCEEECDEAKSDLGFPEDATVKAYFEK